MKTITYEVPGYKLRIHVRASYVPRQENQPPPPLDPRMEKQVVVSLLSAREQCRLACFVLKYAKTHPAQLTQPFIALFQTCFGVDPSQVVNAPVVRRVYEKFKLLREGLCGEVDLADVNEETWEKNRSRYDKLLFRHKDNVDMQTKLPLTLNRVLAVTDNLKLNNAPTLLLKRDASPLDGITGYVRGVMTSDPGRIHITFGYLFDTQQTAWTIIHEGSHKFLKTMDHAYWNDLNRGWEIPLRNLAGVSNADSFAKFAMECTDC